MSDYGRETGSYGNPVHQQVDGFGNPITHSQGQQQTGTTGAYGTHAPPDSQGQQQTGTTGDYGTHAPPGGYGTHAPPGSGAGMHGTGTGATMGTGTDAPGSGAGIGNQQRGLRRSGSSSSSSSEEDDGQGGRRKKGLKDKIKEKMPGGGGKKTDQGHVITTPTPGGATIPMGRTNTTGTGNGGYGGQTEQDHEKKGMMEKIKEKLPGQNKGSTN